MEGVPETSSINNSHAIHECLFEDLNLLSCIKIPIRIFNQEETKIIIRIVKEMEKGKTAIFLPTIMTSKFTPHVYMSSYLLNQEEIAILIKIVKDN